MILIISSKLTGVDLSAKFLGEALDKIGVQYFLLNPHNLASSNCSLVQSGGRIDLMFSSRIISPKIVFMANNWRCDCIIRIPTSIDYPTVFRSKIQQFMNDIRFALDDVIWVPGKYEQIEKADSKVTLMKQAFLAGLRVPFFTSDSFSAPIKTGDYLKKGLGFPFVVSLNNKKGCEVGVTTTNAPYNPDEQADDGQPWQWQTAIKTVGQIRMFVVGSRSWSVYWKRPIDQKNIWDYRQINQVDSKKVLWEQCTLPQTLINQVLSLMNELKISVAAPEFLINENGEYIFIDLNPCGDWFGFFSDEVNNDIVSCLSKFLTRSI